MYYLTDQLSEMKNIWTDHLANRDFINLIRLWKIMSIDYAIDIALRLKEPLQVQKLVNSKTKWYITATAVRNMEAKYFTQEDILAGDDIFDILQASMSVPLVYGRIKTFSGKHYIDGGIGAPFSKTVEKAIEMGATHILAIDASRKQNQPIESLSQHGVDILLMRNQALPARLLTHNSRILTQAFELGYRDAINHFELDNFLK